MKLKFQQRMGLREDADALARIDKELGFVKAVLERYQADTSKLENDKWEKLRNMRNQLEAAKEELFEQFINSQL